MDETKTHLVAVVVFAEVPAVDETDAVYLVERAVSRPLREKPLAMSDEDVSQTEYTPPLTAQVIRVTDMRSAMSSGLIQPSLSPGRIRRGY